MRDILTQNTAVLTKELKTRMRGRRAAIIITAYLVLLAGIGALMLYTQQQQFRYGYSMYSVAAMGSQIFTVLSLLQMFLVVFIVPGLTGAAIAGERDRQTLDLLLATQVPSLAIVLGKILSSLSYVFMLLLAALPVFSLAFLFGGVSPRQVGLSFVISLASALTLGTIGVFLSVMVRRGQIATVLAYSVTFLLLIGIYSGRDKKSHGEYGGDVAPRA
jgi:ABC-type transport system involved in multi-copper enzyme maturation permease subunit